MFLKVHHAPDGNEVVAVCDEELINTTVSHGEIECCISDSFYGTERASEEEVRKVLANAGNINLIGRRAVQIAIDMGLIAESGCIRIGAVPHAQIFRV